MGFFLKFVGILCYHMIKISELIFTLGQGVVLLSRLRKFFGRLLSWIVDWLDWFYTGIQITCPILSWSTAKPI